jgi:hypothetical protein
MPQPERKPLAKAEYPPQESRVPRSIHFTPTEWDGISHAARCRGFAPCAFARMLAIYALSIVQAQALAEASVGVPQMMLGGSSGMLGGSLNGRRF